MNISQLASYLSKNLCIRRLRLISAPFCCCSHVQWSPLGEEVYLSPTTIVIGSSLEGKTDKAPLFSGYVGRFAEKILVIRTIEEGKLVLHEAKACAHD